TAPATYSLSLHAALPISTPADQYFTKAYGVQPFTNEYWNYRPILTNWLEAFNADSIYYDVARWSTPRTTQLYRDAAAETDEAKQIGRGTRLNSSHVKSSY